MKINGIKDYDFFDEGNGRITIKSNEKSLYMFKPSQANSEYFGQIDFTKFTQKEMIIFNIGANFKYEQSKRQFDYEFLVQENRLTEKIESLKSEIIRLKRRNIFQRIWNK